MENNIIIDGKLLAKVFLFLEEPKEDFIKKILDNFPYFDDIGFAGYKDKNTLEIFLKNSVFGFESKDSWKKINVDKCINGIKFVLEKCKNIIEDNVIKIFIFPTLDSFIADKMNGVSGFSHWKNTILLNIYNTDNFENALKNTVCHELCHALALNYNERETLKDDLIFEGLAEHFREYFINKEKSPWVESISEEKIKSILKSIDNKIETKDYSLYKKLFFGSDEYPIWSGYAIGYYIVNYYLNKLEKIEWKEIIKLKPSEIF